ncbi:unnamed protein product [Caenorhabditis bovis]|uniref:DM13 domain-containing protein n=1 Tax=Caenorhabditis bovis TaxID=2654633 RepID=A0A8S1ENU2_9PELO|nr:unnamed protein product [Caenorhabditis bovis]
MSHRGYLFVVLSLSILVQFGECIEYYGNYIGSISTNGIEAEVYLVNTSHIQVVNFRTKTGELAPLPFATLDQFGKPTLASNVYQYLESPAGDWLLKLSSLGNRRSGVRFVLELPGSAAQWKQFAVIGTNGRTIASINIDKPAPKPFCCFERESDIGLFGEYGIFSEPIEVLDSKTLRIPNFSYKASETPDGYFFAGIGPTIDTTSGKKAMIVGRDTPNRICAMHQNIVDQHMVVRLAEGQTIYDIEWLSVFCYQYSHDFGHLDLGLVEDEELVPPFMPDIRASPPPSLPQQSC